MGSDSHEDDEEKTSGVEGPSSEVYSICTGGDGDGGAHPRGAVQPVAALKTRVRFLFRRQAEEEYEEDMRRPADGGSSDGARCCRCAVPIASFFRVSGGREHKVRRCPYTRAHVQQHRRGSGHPNEARVARTAVCAVFFLGLGGGVQTKMSWRSVGLAESETR